jgi:hypothetical protein
MVAMYTAVHLSKSEKFSDIVFIYIYIYILSHLGNNAF